jgi:GT2 family glycosyltransferase
MGIVTYGNLDFTKITLRSVWETVNSPVDFFLVVGNPDDNETAEFLEKEGIPHVWHDFNYGFPYSVNDIYDYAWKENNYDNLVIMGNDVVAYPYAIDSLIHVADTTDNSWVCSREYDVKSLCKEYPEAQKYFDGTDIYRFKDFDARPWEVAIANSPNITPEVRTNGAGLSDVHNLALFKRDIFDVIGYIDVNFYPAYYEDNDYVRRAINAGITKSCRVLNSIYFHFWSRTIHQGSRGASHPGYFHENRTFYMRKWGGDFGSESWDVPFNGQPYFLGDVVLQPDLAIRSREDDEAIIGFWVRKQSDDTWITPEERNTINEQQQKK